VTEGERRTVIFTGAPRERGTPEDDAARNDHESERWWWMLGPVDLRVHPVQRRTWIANPARMMRGGFKR
jgi:hypothetical protein